MVNILSFLPAFHSAKRRSGMQNVAALVGGTALAVALPACGPVYPRIAQVGGDAAFKARIAESFPPGTRAERLRAELMREGFELLENPVRRAYSGVRREDNLPCYSETRIDWLEDRRGRITTIQAARHSCT